MVPSNVTKSGQESNASLFSESVSRKALLFSPNAS
jgi:hypothetical protein